MTWAYGKAILLGEHAVVYGYPALAGAIDCPLRCTVSQQPSAAASQAAGDHAIGLRVPAWSVAVTVAASAVAAGAAHDPALPGPARALAALLERLGAHLGMDVAAALGPAELVVDTRLPAAAGLGSSAALSVALVRTLASRLGHALPAADIETIADSAERCFHQNPSGVDVALATRGGLGLYRRGHGLAALDAQPLALAVGLSGQARSTAAMVARVAAAHQADPTGADAQLALLGAAAEQGAQAMLAGDERLLGTLMTRAHRTLAALGVSSPVLDQLVDIAQAAGALGAKLTGAGGGGAVIALGHGHQESSVEAIVRAWQAAGFDGFVCHVGVRP